MKELKNKLNWKSKEVVNIYDEVTLWSAPFGRVLLENIPMKPLSEVLDIGFGTGFPLIELSQRFGENATIYGIDIWKNGILKAKEKIKTLGLKNVTIFNQSATLIPLPNNQVDLIVSNLGINNFDDKDRILKEAFRVLKMGGSLCITTNTISTFNEIFEIFDKVLDKMNLVGNKSHLQKYISNRSTKDNIVNEFEKIGFKLKYSITDFTQMRFVNARAVFDHSLIRIGFLEYWKKIIPKKKIDVFFKNVENLIDLLIKEKGEFKLLIPIQYFEFIKISKTL